MTIYRPGQRLYYIGDPGATVYTPSAAAAASWWLAGGIDPANAIAVYQPKGAASYAASKVNLANPGTYDAAEGVAPTWASATGWTFNGTTQYLKTGVEPGAGYAMFIRVDAALSPSSGEWAAGVVKIVPSSNGVTFRLTAATQVFVHFGDAAANVNLASVLGVHAIVDSAYYYNGSWQVALGSWTFALGQDIYIGSRNFNGAPNGYAEMTVSAFAIYSPVPSAVQIAAISAAMALL